MDNISLYYREGSSDKVYQANIRPKGGGFLVQFAYGRRGSTFKTGTKTQSPVDYQEAKRIYDKLIKEKTAKGYQPGTDAPQYQNDIELKQSSGIQCQLLNPVTEDHIEDLINDHEFWMQEKMDGRRMLVHKEGINITGINRLGLTVALPQTIVESAASYDGDFLIDGEGIGETLHAFDLLFISGEDMRTSRFAVRYFRLRDLLSAFKQPVGASSAGITATTTNTTSSKDDAKSALAQIESIKSAFRESISGLTKLGDTLRLALREQKSGDKDLQSVRQTLRTLQNVRI